MRLSHTKTFYMFNCTVKANTHPLLADVKIANKKLYFKPIFISITRVDRILRACRAGESTV